MRRSFARPVRASFHGAGRVFSAAIAVCLALVAGASEVEAGLITWGTARTISGDGDVVTTGSVLYAYNFGEDAVAATTVNGVTFAPFAIPSTNPPPKTVTVGNVTLTESPDDLYAYGSFGSGSTPYSTLSASYQKLLDQAAYAAGPETITVTLGGLQVGEQYLVQWWASDSYPLWGALVTASSANSVTLDSNTTDLAGGFGQYAIGTFTAASTSEAFTLVGSAGSGSFWAPMINGLQVRAVPTPIPEIDPAGFGSVAALITGTLGLIERRRLKPKAA